MVFYLFLGNVNLAQEGTFSKQYALGSQVRDNIDIGTKWTYEVVLNGVATTYETYEVIGLTTQNDTLAYVIEEGSGGVLDYMYCIMGNCIFRNLAFTYWWYMAKLLPNLSSWWFWISLGHYFFTPAYSATKARKAQKNHKNVFSGIWCVPCFRGYFFAPPCPLSSMCSVW
jgi:hypothetical protein